MIGLDGGKILISIIIPLFNAENYIIQCLDSFEKQIYKMFEIIIVNDGSKDNSASIVESYSKKSDMKIKLINQENAGVSAARNKGLDNASGEYICFVDADDMVGPEYLSQMVDIINEYDCELVICGFKPIPENWDISLYIYKKYHTKIMTSDEVLRKFLYQDIVSGVWSLMVKRNVIKKNSLRFAEGYRYSEDLEMVWKLISHSKNVAYNRSQLYIYRVRNGSAMSFVDDRRMDGFALIKGLEKYFERVHPNFAKEFKHYGTARWVWATLWQAALVSDNYKSFLVVSNKLNAKKYMKKLFTYPKLCVAISSFTYCILPFLYYCTIRKIGIKRLNNRRLLKENKIH